MALALRVAEVRAEHLLTELLEAQGWDTRRPPNGELLRQHEYKDHRHLFEIFRGSSKSGGKGDALPEAVLIDRNTLQPCAVVEAKAVASDLMLAVREATETYGNACIAAGFNPLAIAIAGTSEDDFAVRVFKWTGRKWSPITYEGKPISWIPNRNDIENLRAVGSGTELRPSIPPPEVLAAHADEINRLLRESKVKDELRPAIVGALMLALWQSKGNVRKDPSNVLADINKACQSAFWKAGKPDLAKSLYVDEANDTLAIKVRRIITILERLNVTVLTAEHDYLGQLYETFFRYTGGNTIGQYFTPRHITYLCAQLCGVGKDDIVLDPACGTGGFLIAAMNRIMEVGNLSRTQVVKVVKKQLIGFETEPITAALCVANMILRGDGSTGITRADCLSSQDFPRDTVDVVLMNPPFPHKDTDDPPERFVDRALQALKRRGRLGAVVPMQLLVKPTKAAWRKGFLKNHTLNGIITLPDELFLPYAQPYTNILLVTKGVPHNFQNPVFFARIDNDGLRLRKNVRVPRPGSQIETVISAYEGRKNIDGLCGWAPIAPDGEWRPGAYIPARKLSAQETLDEVGAVIRSKTVLTVKFAPVFAFLAADLETREQSPRDFREYVGPKRKSPVSKGHTIGVFFDIYYGQGELESKESFGEGLTPVISSSGDDNGCHGFYDFDWLIKPPIVTAPRTGSIGMAHVQEWPCGASSDNLILLPKAGVEIEMLYIAAAVIRKERWRFNYGAKMTPGRIADFPLPTDITLIEAIREELANAAKIEATALEAAQDSVDARIAKEVLEHIDGHPEALISGPALEKRLSILMAN
jgi:type I restriction enzyme M protein